MVKHTRQRGEQSRAILLEHLRSVDGTRSPTISEMAAALEWSKRRVQHNLDVLVEQQKVVHHPGSRGYVPAPPSESEA